MSQNPSHYEKAVAFLDQKNETQAEIELKAAIEENANDSQSLFLLGDIYYRSERYNTAIEILSRVYQLNPDHIKTQERLFFSYLNMREMPNAFKIALSIRNQHPNEARSWYLIGKYFFVLQDYSQTEINLKYALSLEPHFEPAKKLLDHLPHSKNPVKIIESKQPISNSSDLATKNKYYYNETPGVHPPKAFGRYCAEACGCLILVNVISIFFFGIIFYPGLFFLIIPWAAKRRDENKYRADPTRTRTKAIMDQSYITPLSDDPNACPNCGLARKTEWKECPNCSTTFSSPK